mmetsp:Transcript_4503/g.4270  ORF Transcript_4503/g.4270 Transcript_4503/m.4270 type:complete len:192 (-) Transcript_4503:105-680(-)
MTMMKCMIQPLFVVLCYLAASTNAFSISSTSVSGGSSSSSIISSIRGSSSCSSKKVGGAVRYGQMDTRRFNYFENLGSMYRNFGRKATASHICIGPRKMDEDAAKEFLTDLKLSINDDLDKFAEAAAEHSGCPSGKKEGGSLGEFGPGMMVKNFDTVCFEKEVGIVHGPVSTQFGEHLIIVTKRTGGEQDK